MKLYSQQAELTAIRAATSRKGNHLIAKIDENGFHLPETQEAWLRLAHLAKVNGEAPSYGELCLDPSLSEETRALLSKRKPAIPSDPAAILRQVETYAKIRSLFNLYRDGLESLKAPKVNLGKLVEKASEQLTSIRLQRNVDNLLFHIGKKDNVSERLRDLIFNKKRVATIKTGLTTYDERNGGLPERGLVVLTANTGGLKSTLAQQLLDNMYCNGSRAVYASFEMTFEELMFKLFARNTGINSMDILLNRITAKQRKQIWEFYQAYTKKGAKAGGQLTILDSTDTELGIKDVLGTVAPFGPNVVIIDYVTLLADAADDNQAQALSDVARYAKMWSKRNCLVILLAQLSDENKIRYSRAISEHADVWWRWTIGTNERETGLFDIDQAKARNQNPFPFQLSVDFTTSLIKDASDPSGAGVAALGGNKSKLQAEKRSKLHKGVTEITDDYLDKL